MGQGFGAQASGHYPITGSSGPTPGLISDRKCLTSLRTTSGSRMMTPSSRLSASALSVRLALPSNATRSSAATNSACSAARDLPMAERRVAGQDQKVASWRMASNAAAAPTGPCRAPPSSSVLSRIRSTPHSASRSHPEFVNHLRDAERGETNDQQRLLAVMDQLANDRSGEPDGRRVAHRAADHDVGAPRRGLGPTLAADSSARATAAPDSGGSTACHAAISRAAAPPSAKPGLASISQVPGGDRMQHARPGGHVAGGQPTGQFRDDRAQITGRPGHRLRNPMRAPATVPTTSARSR